MLIMVPLCCVLCDLEQELAHVWQYAWVFESRVNSLNIQGQVGQDGGHLDRVQIAEDHDSVQDIANGLVANVNQSTVGAWS